MYFIFKQVDIYGRCGTLTCPSANRQDCYNMLNRDYKFYLAFENSNCKNYITEKLFENALARNILPIVMGAPIEEYQKYAPQQSFIHVDEFESPAELAQFLHILDKNDEEYNSYFAWKGTGQFVNNPNNFFCELCARLHDNKIMSNSQWVDDINEWWRGKGICMGGSWRDATKNLSERYKLKFMGKKK